MTNNKTASYPERNKWFVFWLLASHMQFSLKDNDTFKDTNCCAQTASLNYCSTKVAMQLQYISGAEYIWDCFISKCFYSVRLSASWGMSTRDIEKISQQMQHPIVVKSMIHLWMSVLWIVSHKELKNGSTSEGTGASHTHQLNVILISGTWVLCTAQLRSL